MLSRATFVDRLYALHASSDMSRMNITDGRHRALLLMPLGPQKEQPEFCRMSRVLTFPAKPVDQGTEFSAEMQNLPKKLSTVPMPALPV
jgi:hypothetical protein